jgi:hypothetical protein
MRGPRPKRSATWRGRIRIQGGGIVKTKRTAPSRARREIDTKEGVSAAMTRAVLCQRRVERAAALDDEVTSQTSSSEANDRSGNRSDPQRGPGASSWKRDPARGSRIVTNAPEVGSVVKNRARVGDTF